MALHAGQPERAKAYVERIPEARRRATTEPSPSWPEERAPSLGTGGRRLLGLAELHLGNEDRGRDLLSEVVDSVQAVLERREGSSRLQHRRLTEAYAALGQTKLAFRHLERWAPLEAGFQNPAGSISLLVSPFFESLRSERRFQKMVQKLQAERREGRKRILQMGLDLYPPGAAPDSAVSQSQSNE